MNNTSDESDSDETVSSIASTETAKISTVNSPAIDRLSLILARFSFKDSLDLEVIGTDTSTSRIEADEEDNLDNTKQHSNIITEQQQEAVASCSTPVATNLPKSKLRSGKIFRKSKSTSECLLDIRNKIVTNQNCKSSADNFQQNKEVDSKSIKSQNIQTENKMVDVGMINALVFNNIPILTCENNSNLKSELNVFFRCVEFVENCITEEEKPLFLQLLGSRIRSKAADALQGSSITTSSELKKALTEKLLNNKPYHLLRTELQNLYQFSAESVESFGNRVYHLLKECKDAITVTNNQVAHDAIEKELEEHALYIFKSGISNINLRWFCLADTESNFKTLLEKVAKLETTERQTNCKNSFNSNIGQFANTNMQNTSQVGIPNSTPPTHGFPSNNYQ